jgi:hypothetical protein
MKLLLKYLLVASLLFRIVSCNEKKPSYDQLLDEHNKNNSFTNAIYGLLVLSFWVYVGYKVGTFKSTQEPKRKNKFDQMVGNGTFSSEKDDEDDFHPTV